jgi:flavin reductase (DIM6/NTAB) family NADH-FMN oxidoreductase RutF
MQGLASDILIAPLHNSLITAFFCKIAKTNISNNNVVLILKESVSMKKEIPVRDGLRQLPIRPVYLVSVEHEGKKNIISIGMFAFFSGKPTVVGVGIAPARYSFDLVRQSGEYVVNVVDEKLMKAVRICGRKSGREVNKSLNWQNLLLQEELR